MQAANAERAVMDDAGEDTMLMVLMAEGIGSAIVDSGRLVTGARGRSGELGPTIVGVKGRADTFDLLAGAKAFVPLNAADRSVDDGVAQLLESAGIVA